MGHQSFYLSKGYDKIPSATVLELEGPFSDLPLFGNYLRITNRSEKPSTSMPLLVNPLAKEIISDKFLKYHT